MPRRTNRKESTPSPPRLAALRSAHQSRREGRVGASLSSFAVHLGGGKRTGHWKTLTTTDLASEAARRGGAGGEDRRSAKGAATSPAARVIQKPAAHTRMLWR